ncbi:hypothetical protein C0995_012970 [Termitomyces sp. Mi166|nr:hypothetical protein C0995_012970 [Termitomyces sp. Mi166\
MVASNVSGAGLGLDFLSDRCNGLVDSLENTGPTYGEDLRLGTSQAATSPLSNTGPRCPVDSSSSTRITANEPQALTRHGTLLSANATPGRNAEELGSVMGDSTSRLKPGAMVLEGTLLEQAKTRARVEVDIILDSYTYVQGGYLQGHMKIKILECTRNEVPVMISGGKVRVIGFENISNELDKYPFYQCSSPLETVTVTSGDYHDSRRDSEGFAQAIEGEHTLPFSMYLPMSADYGMPKGSIRTQAGVAVRYIAMVSIKVKDPISHSRSIAHFYRSCEIWPRLDPSIILAPAGKPLQAKTTVDFDPRLAGLHRISLTASVYRLHWVAGQQCFVKVSVANESKKTVKSIALALIRTTIVFKPSYHANTFEGAHDQNYDVCSTSMSQKLIAESVLDMGQRAPRHASAKGWWTGVAPGEHLDFSHSILVPLQPDALSVIRSRLLQVDYSVRVTLSAGGKLRMSELQVILPIRIINLISIDPPPSLSPLHLPQNAPISATLHKRPFHTGEIQLMERFPLENTNMRALRRCAEEKEERFLIQNESHTTPDDLDLVPEDAFHGIDYDFDADSAENANYDMDLNRHEDPECFTVYEDDADEIVPRILQDDPQFENAPRFADLYYASVQDLKLPSVSHSKEERVNCSSTYPSQYHANLAQKVREYTMLRSGLRLNSLLPSHRKSKGPSSFASRVQAKLAAAAEAGSLSGRGHVFSGSIGSAPSSSTVTEASLFRESMTGPPLGDRHKLRQPHGHVSSEPLACDDKHTTLVTLPTSESTSSLPYTRSSTFTSGDRAHSRLLPKAPVAVDVNSAVYRMDDLASTGCTTHDSGHDATQPSTFLLQLETDMTPRRLPHHQEQAPKPNEKLEIDDNGLGLNHPFEVRTGVLPRPSFFTFKEQQAGANSKGTTNSVKERIRELEERQRSLGLNEANGLCSFV